MLVQYGSWPVDGGVRDQAASFVAFLGVMSMAIADARED